jgi:hypothetical protein
MKTWNRDNRSMGLFFGLAVALHAALIMVPLSKQMIATVEEQIAVEIRLIQPAEAPPERPPPQPAPERRKPEITALEELPSPPEMKSPPLEETDQQPPPPSSKRMLSSQFDYERSVRQPIFGPSDQQVDAPDFFYRKAPSLDAVLNRPALQLPFEDTRTYLVDYYEDGFMGGMGKFWDNVSVPFGFTTKNNTRVQCVWVLVIAGCGWGHNSMFQKSARYRGRPASHSIENS